MLLPANAIPEKELPMKATVLSGGAMFRNSHKFYTVLVGMKAILIIRFLATGQ